MTLKLADPNLATLRTSGITDLVIELAKIESITDPKLAAKMVGWRESWTAEHVPAIAFPYFSIAREGGEPKLLGYSLRAVKPLIPPKSSTDGAPTRYKRTAKMVPVYLPPDLVANPALLDDPTVPKLITEGEKKALAASSIGLPCVSISGVDCWGPRKEGSLPKKPHDLIERLAKSGSELFLFLDSDQATNSHVSRAQAVFCDALTRLGARVYIARLPHEGGVDGNKLGLDDFIGGGAAGFHPREAVEELMAEARAAGPHKVEDETGGLAKVEIGPDEQRFNDEVLEALVAVEPPINLYRRGSKLVRVGQRDEAPRGMVMREADQVTLQRLTSPQLREIMSRWVYMEKGPTEKKGPERVHPPKWSVDAILDRGHWPKVLPLHQVTETPLLAASGRVIQAPGYDVESGVYYSPLGPFPIVPSTPTVAQLREARAALEHVICDYRFKTPAHRSGFFAAVFTMLARFSFEGPTPAFLFDASTAGAGKGLLAKVATVIGTGRVPPDTVFIPGDEAEMDKRIISWAISGVPVVLFDNVTGLFGGAALCSALTSTKVGGRILSKSEDWSGDIFTTWLATANNVDLGTDMHRRVVHVRIEAPESPEERTDFVHPELLSWVREHRASLAAAALTILRGYFVAGGRPKTPIKGWGSYEGWSRVVRGALVWAGWPDPIEAVEELRQTADARALKTALVRGWGELCDRRNAPNGLTVKHALAALFPTEAELFSSHPELAATIEELCGGESSKRARSLGNLMKALRGKAFGGRALVGKEDRSGVAVWRVEGAGSAGSAGSVPTDSRARSQTMDPPTRDVHAYRAPPGDTPQTPQTQQTLQGPPLLTAEERAADEAERASLEGLR